ncbi:DNA-binding transcriptional regulator, Lrp family [Jatrophihabitans endophyticus]|uniref:DNA-binding transcriptional regulator, Lrp family n=1 Tax=Jatrophihabitans endophyticus TaxID=1206085 RepID=A0A1M5GWZ0_9ACTN|nr:Lrp/AsnC family transcriptional regulator [Jatrophihabitans endophyticus]SHG08249.1 DNA-binding transcriptional regulator, Lrp family [Jatrophihabitans endophyticus]
MLSETASIDVVDAQIIRCLQLSPRIPFRTVADILALSEQTVARRYRRLVGGGIVRVTVVLRPTAFGQTNWTVRTKCRPSGAESLAQALARRDDVSWVTLAAGGAEVLWVLRARSQESRDELLMHRLPRSAPVLDISAAMLLHRYVGVGTSPADDWAGLADLLDAQQAAAATATMALRPCAEDRRFEFRPGDTAMLDVLKADARASYATLADAAGTTEARAARRLRTLVEDGAAYLDVDIALAAIGMHASATLWLTVPPSRLHAAGTALASAPEVGFAGAVTGPQNLMASVVCRDVEHLYRMVTETVGAIEGVQSLAISPVSRQLKQADALVDGDRLAVS